MIIIIIYERNGGERTLEKENLNEISVIDYVLREINCENFLGGECL